MEGAREPGGRPGIWPPLLWGEQPRSQQIAGVTIGPIFFGALCGWMMSVSEVAYTVLTLLAITGGIAAGYEHLSYREAALRGLFIGTLFSLTICETHRLIGDDSLASTPKPVELIVPVFALISVLLCIAGAALRRRREA